MEIAVVDVGAAVRDSKNPHGPRLYFGRRQWAEFVELAGATPA